MKTLLLLLSITFGMSVLAQPYYFSEYESDYEGLTAPTLVNGTTVWSGFQTFSVPIGFSFDYMDASFTSFDFEATGRIIFDANHYYFADLFTVSGLQDKGTSGSQIFKLEVSNATFAGDLTATIDFQIWLYESDGRLELHMGPNTINDAGAAFTSGPFCGVNHITNWTPATYGYGLAIYDDLANLKDTTFSGTGITTTPFQLADCPSENTVYCFSPNMPSVSVSPLSFKKNEQIIYPNPSTDFIYRKINNPDEDRVEFRKANGRLLLSSEIKDEYDIRSFPNGLYIMLILDKEGKVLSENRLVKN
jgi:hypothetical protein